MSCNSILVKASYTLVQVVLDRGTDLQPLGLDIKIVKVDIGHYLLFFLLMCLIVQPHSSERKRREFAITDNRIYNAPIFNHRMAVLLVPDVWRILSRSTK